MFKRGVEKKGFKRIQKTNKIKKRKLIVLAFLIVALVFASFFIFFLNKYNIRSCGDGTLDGSCSSIKPYFCSEGILIEKASLCGCPDIFSQSGDTCISEYQTEPKNITLKYILSGKEKEIEFTVYKGVVDYLSGLPRQIYYRNGEEPLRKDFKLKGINDPIQKEFLLPLVIKIQNIAKDKTEQVRIATSLVQKIPFGNSDKITRFRKNIINYSRYPYEVLYDVKGVCGEKSELLVFLLREMGYGTAFLHYSFENHESVGIKCPFEYSVDETGYCFIETTGPSIITDAEVEYVGIGRLLSKPEIIVISDGDSLDKNLYEYRDAEELIRIRRSLENRGKINFFQHKILENLKKKYGLEKVYNP
ncbi:hypothetical protein DRN69_03600 [Candidatus Pacearchaeota archaeon]|nr:MAG: hypothetical protein DRN69_03600 [Candidatus Pacearchaeota archaeon]